MTWLLLPVAMVSGCGPARSPAPAGVRLLTFDCGRIDVPDMGAFAEKDEPTGRPGVLVVPCFVVRHPRGTLVWETGLPDALVGHPHVDPWGEKTSRERTFRDALAAVGIAPGDVRLFATSHLHADHAGNADLFPGATWLLDRRELAWGLTTPAPPGVDPATATTLRAAHVRALDGDLDVFGDGAVRLVRTPGHTPGHRSLVLRLAHAGTVVLSGDLAHTRANWEGGIVPFFNVDVEETRRSMAALRALLAAEHARLVVEHDGDDLATLPRAPAWLD